MDSLHPHNSGSFAGYHFVIIVMNIYRLSEELPYAAIHLDLAT